MKAGEVKVAVTGDTSKLSQALANAQGAVAQLQTGRVGVYQPYVQPHTNVWPTTTWIQPAVKTDEERLRFALELILEGDLTHDAVKKIAKKALRKP